MSGIRATGAEAYSDGTGTFHPPQQRIEDGRAIVGERRVRVDACVIGSGAGGAVVAKELAEGGMRVAILEEGDWWQTDDFTARPRDMTPLLYRDAGQIVTVGVPPIVLPLGRAVGGSTLINSATCFRTPGPILSSWRERFGLERLTEDELDPYFRRVERELHVAQVPPEIAGRNAEVVRRGAQRLGWSGDFVYRNAKGCVGSGVCNFGCPTGAKQHVGITFIPKAWAAGATTFTAARAEGIELSGGRARAVIARTRGGGALRVECTHVIVACGTIHTPGFLRRQGIGAASGQLGRNLAIHPATALRAFFEERIGMPRGVPQSYYVDEFAHEGIMFEGAAGPPDYMAMSLPSTGAEHRELMLRYPHTSQFGVMVSDTSRGEVREFLGRPQIRYSLNDHDVAAFKRGFELLAELYWAAGAQSVVLPIHGLRELRDGALEPLRRHRLRASQLTLMAFHPLGTARAGADPAASVVDPELRVHGLENVHVADGSVVPSSLGVNPQITIMALAARLAFHLLGAPAPLDEPEPEHIARPRVQAVHAAA